MIDNFPAIFNFTSYFSNLTGSFVNNCAPVLPDHRARLPCSSVKGGVRRTKYLRVDFQFSLRVRWLVITAEGAGPWLIYWGLVADSPNLIITAHLHRHAKKPNYQPCISKAQHLSSNFRRSGVSLEYIYIYICSFFNSVWGDFWGMISQNPSVLQSNQVTYCDLSNFLFHLSEVHSKYSSRMVADFSWSLELLQPVLSQTQTSSSVTSGQFSLFHCSSS